MAFEKKLLSVVLTLALAFALVPMFGSQTYADSKQLVSNEAELREAVAAGGSIQLTSDVVLSDGYLQILKDSPVYLDLNGHVLCQTSESAVIRNNGDLTIVDSNTDKLTHYYTVSSTGMWVLNDSNKANAYTLDEVIASPAAVTSGAVIAVSGGAITGGSSRGGIINFTKLTMTGVNIIGNDTVQAGGAIYSFGAGFLGWDDIICSEAAVSLTDCRLIGNTALYAGGGIYNHDEFAVKGGVIGFNVVQNDEALGAGIYNLGGTVSLDSVLITANSSIGTAAFGAGIQASEGTVNMLNVTVSNNEAIGSETAGGAAMYISHATVSIKGGSIVGNRSVATESYVYGGAIYKGTDDSAYMLLEDVSIKSNTAVSVRSYAYGGGIYTRSGKMTVNGGSIVDNKAVSQNINSYGGGIYNCATLNVNNVTQFSGNTAGAGGAIYNISDGSSHPGTLNVNDCKINGNEAKRGGGLCAVSTDSDYGIVTLTGSTDISNNTSSKLGFSNFFIDGAKVNSSKNITGFIDVSGADYFVSAVLWAAGNDITDGVDSTHFNPNGITTRAQMVTFLWRAAGCPEPTVTSCEFTDVASDTYFYKAVLWAVENGITDGTSDTTFSPYDKVTRGQAITFLWRYEGSIELDIDNPFTDVSEEAFYYNAVLWAKGSSITDGTTENTFSPDATCTRAQALSFLCSDMVQ